MSAIVLQHFTISMENAMHNVVAQTTVLAETDVDAIELAKAKLKDSIEDFINNVGKVRSQRTQKKLVANFWQNTKIVCNVSKMPTVLRFDYDVLNKAKGGLGSAVE